MRYRLLSGLAQRLFKTRFKWRVTAIGDAAELADIRDSTKPRAFGNARILRSAKDNNKLTIFWMTPFEI